MRSFLRSQVPTALTVVTLWLALHAVDFPRAAAEDVQVDVPPTQVGPICADRQNVQALSINGEPVLNLTVNRTCIVAYIGETPNAVDTACDTRSCNGVHINDTVFTGNVLNVIPTSGLREGLYWGTGRVWTSEDDGAGSGVDADRLDGLDGAAFAPAGHDHDSRYHTQAQSDGRYLGATAKAADADKVDGIDGGQILRSDQPGTLAGSLTVNGDLTVNGNVYARNGVMASGTVNVVVSGVQGYATVDVSSLGFTDSDYRVSLTARAGEGGAGPDGHGPLFNPFYYAKSSGSFGVLLYDVNNNPSSIIVPVDWVVVK